MSREGQRKYRKTLKGKATASRYYISDAKKANNKRYRSGDGHAEKHLAHQKLYIRVKKGLIKKPGCCSKCGSGGKIYGHHEDYSEPYSVIWVCPKCHYKEHKGGDER